MGPMGKPLQEEFSRALVEPYTTTLEEADLKRTGRQQMLWIQTLSRTKKATGQAMQKPRLLRKHLPGNLQGGLKMMHGR